MKSVIQTVKEASSLYFLPLRAIWSRSPTERVASYSFLLVSFGLALTVAATPKRYDQLALATHDDVEIVRDWQPAPSRPSGPPGPPANIRIGDFDLPPGDAPNDSRMDKEKKSRPPPPMLHAVPPTPPQSSNDWVKLETELAAQRAFQSDLRNLLGRLSSLTNTAKLTEGQAADLRILKGQLEQMVRQSELEVQALQSNAAAIKRPRPPPPATLKVN